MKNKTPCCAIPNCPALRLRRKRWCAVHDEMLPSQRLDEWRKAAAEGDIPRFQPDAERICYERDR